MLIDLTQTIRLAAFSKEARVSFGEYVIGRLAGIAVGIAVSLAIPKMLGWPSLVSTIAIVGSVIFSAGLATAQQMRTQP